MDLQTAQRARQAHAAFADGLDLPPAAQQPDVAAVRRMRTQGEETAVGNALAEGLGEGFQQAGEAIGVEVDLGVAAQGVGDGRVEHLGLGRGQHGSHLEDMGDRRFLEIAHGRVEMIDRRLDLRGVAVAGGVDGPGGGGHGAGHSGGGADLLAQCRHAHAAVAADGDSRGNRTAQGAGARR